jgi:hypothetical protein
MQPKAAFTFGKTTNSYIKHKAEMLALRLDSQPNAITLAFNHHSLLEAY